MDKRNVPWKAEWKAAGLDPGPLNPEEEALVGPLQAENAEFLRKHPWKAPVAKPVRLVPTWTAWSVPLVAAAALLFVVVPRGTDADAGPGYEGLKGSGKPATGVSVPADRPVLSIYRQGSSQPEHLKAQAVVRPGEVLQAAYQVSRPMQGALLSVDGGGNVTVQLAQGGRSTTLVPGKEQFLEFSYELDRAPRYEVFVLVTADQPFDLEPVRQKLKTAKVDQLAADLFGPEVRFTALPLVKGSAP